MFYPGNAKLPRLAWVHHAGETVRKLMQVESNPVSKGEGLMKEEGVNYQKRDRCGTLNYYILF